MAAENVYLSREGYEKLREELEYLKTTRRHELSKAIGKARDHGDISENAEYDAARESQALNEERISNLGDKLSRARIIEDENIATDKAYIGAKLLLKDLDSKEELEYTLVSEVEADYEQGKVSITSPVGKGLLGKGKGEKVEIEIPAGVLKYKILKISR